MFLYLVFFEKFLPVNMKLLLTVKIAPGVNNYLPLVYAVQELRSSLHVSYKQLQVPKWSKIKELLSTKYCPGSDCP